MKKRIILLGTISIVVIITFIYFKYIFGWLEFKSNNYTSDKYISLIHVSKKQYLKDSLCLVSEIKEKIKNHQEPYTRAIRVNEKLEYINDSLTKIYIDSIFYSPDLNKIAFLVLVENDNRKLYNGMTKSEADSWAKEGNLPYKGTFFDGNCFIAKKEKEFIKIYYYGYSFSNSITYKENSSALRNACLNNAKKTDYNIDDKRFWDSNEWKLIK